MPQRTLYASRIVPSDDVPTRILLCATIAMGTAVFFWVYDAAAHREAPFVPSTSVAPTGHDLSGAREDRARVLQFSHVDVEPVRSVPESNNTLPNYKIVKTVKRISPEAANAYASGATYRRHEVGAPE